MRIVKKRWGEHQGVIVWLYSIKSETIEISMTNYGCTIVSIRVQGKNVIPGYSGFEELLADKYYMGSIVGRFAGRISKSSFEIDGTKYHLTANDGTSGNHLHGGTEGFNRISFEEISRHQGENNASITFHGNSEHMEQGYPGKVDITFIITLNVDNEIKFSYLAMTDRATHINLTHHLYYNLCGMRPATDQHLGIDASSIAATGEDYIPTGKIVPVPELANFLISRKIPADIDYNECYVLNKPKQAGIAAGISDQSMVVSDHAAALTGHAAVLMDPDSGLTMELSTTCPAIIFYSGQFLDTPFFPKQGICLEAQYFPDSPNHTNFPSTLYTKQRGFEEHTKLQFKNIT